MSKPFIKGGTPIGSESLCKTCSYAHIMTGYRESECVTMCNEVHPNIVVPFVIHECTGYYDKNRPSWKLMEKLAINITPDPLKKVGFKVGVGVGVGFGNTADSELDDDPDDACDE